MSNINLYTIFSKSNNLNSNIIFVDIVNFKIHDIMIKYSFTFLLLLNGLALFAQKPEVFEATGKYSDVWNQITESQIDAKKRVFELAKRDLMLTSFPTNISAYNEFEIKDSVRMKSSIETIIKGEIIDITDTVFKYTDRKEKGGKITEIFCQVKAKVRSLDNPQIPLEVLTLKSDNIIKSTSDFKIGDNFYIYFKSPVSGFLNIYVETPDMVQRVFPYSGMSKSYEYGVPVDADKEYILFSPDHIYFNEPRYVTDELKFMPSSRALESNHVFVIFTKEQLTKPSLKSNSQIKLKDGFTLPPSLSILEFKEWRVKNLTQRYDMQINDLFITIRQ